jgi:hypothetical protein
MTSTELEVRRLVYTSVDDLRTQLKFAKINTPLDQEIIARAHQLCLQHGYKTKAKLLNSMLK